MTLHRTLVLEGGFPNVDQPMLLQVLRSMGAADLIEQTPDGLLITGLLGEKIVRHHDFYVAFIVHEEYRVNHAGHHVGNIAFVPEFEEEQIPHPRRAPVADPRHRSRTKGDHGPAFPGRSSSRFSLDDRGRDIHPRVREVMKALAGTGAICRIYLDMKAREMLLQARATAATRDLLRNSFLQDGPDAIWFTWTGSRIQRTLWGLGNYFGGLKVTDEEVALVFEKTTVARVQEIYRGFLTNCPDAVSLASNSPTACGKIRLLSFGRSDRHVFARERLISTGALTIIRANLPSSERMIRPSLVPRHEHIL